MQTDMKRKVLAAVLFCGCLLTALISLETLSDPRTRHVVAAFGLVLEVAGVILMFSNRKAISRGRGDAT